MRAFGPVEVNGESDALVILMLTSESDAAAVRLAFIELATFPTCGCFICLRGIPYDLSHYHI